jgi:hypothetical protein
MGKKDGCKHFKQNFKMCVLKDFKIFKTKIKKLILEELL